MPFLFGYPRNAEAQVFALILLIPFIAFLMYILSSLSTAMNNDTQTTTLEPKPYDDSLVIDNLAIKDISSSGATILFNTPTRLQDLSIQYYVYPVSDILTSNKVISVDNLTHEGFIKTYPEGGTVYYRIIQGDYTINKGTKWLRIDLPRNDNAVLPPPYAPDVK